METMAKKRPRARRSFTSEFKAEIVELCRRGDRSVGQVARDFDLTETAVSRRIARIEHGRALIRFAGLYQIRDERRLSLRRFE